VTSLGSESIIGVLGAGAMGSGIAQVAAAAGHQVLVTDSSAEALELARARLTVALAREVGKGRLHDTAARGIEERITWAPGTAGEYGLFRHCALVIEAIVEDLGVKREAFRRLEAEVSEECVLASNTSSLSITALAAACQRPKRVLGMHFFNPAPLLPLVELIPGLRSAPGTASLARKLVEGWGKTVVLSSDTPGFIVNRVARPFYGEALRIYEEGVADKATIDWAMRELGGFRMGPFELMDLIGNDVNYAVTRSIFEGLHGDARYAPAVTQQRMVEAGLLGRKTGRGHYDYGEGTAQPEPLRDPLGGQAICERILALLINAAVDALFWRVASRDAIDLAMTKGVHYPKGLLRWADELGSGVVLERLEQLQRDYGEERYRPSPLLRRMVRAGERFYP